MKLILLLSAIVGTIFTGNAKAKSSEIFVNGSIHDQKVMINGLDRPYQLSYAWWNQYEVLYFSVNYGKQNESTFEVVTAINGSAVPDRIKGVKNGFATVIDKNYEYVYYGGSDGIYKQYVGYSFNAVSKIESKYNIWDLFHKDDLYFITYPKGRLYKHVSNNTSELQRHIREKIYQFAIDGVDDTFITNDTGLFMIKNGSQHRIHIKGATVFRAIAVNNDGVVHLCGRNEIYVVDKKKHELQKVAKIKNIFGLTFDVEDNIIFSDPHQIVKLVPREPKKRKDNKKNQENKEEKESKEEKQSKKEKESKEEKELKTPEERNKTISHLVNDKAKEIKKVIISSGQPLNPP